MGNVTCRFGAMPKEYGGVITTILTFKKTNIMTLIEKKATDDAYPEIIFIDRKLFQGRRKLQKDRESREACD